MASWSQFAILTIISVIIMFWAKFISSKLIYGLFGLVDYIVLMTVIFYYLHEPISIRITKNVRIAHSLSILWALIGAVIYGVISLLFGRMYKPIFITWNVIVSLAAVVFIFWFFKVITISFYYKLEIDLTPKEFINYYIKYTFHDKPMLKHKTWNIVVVVLSIIIPAPLQFYDVFKFRQIHLIKILKKTGEAINNYGKDEQQRNQTYYSAS